MYSRPLSYADTSPYRAIARIRRRLTPAELQITADGRIQNATTQRNRDSNWPPAESLGACEHFEDQMATGVAAQFKMARGAGCELNRD